MIFYLNTEKKTLKVVDLKIGDGLMNATSQIKKKKTC